MALITLESQENHSIQPSELSCALGSSRPNATRIADELEKRGWIERRESDNDRRSLSSATDRKGPSSFCARSCRRSITACISSGPRSAPAEKDRLEHITRKLLCAVVDQMEQDGVARGRADANAAASLRNPDLRCKENMPGQHRNSAGLSAGKQVGSADE